MEIRVSIDYCGRPLYFWTS